MAAVLRIVCSLGQNKLQGNLGRSADCDFLPHLRFQNAWVLHHLAWTVCLLSIISLSRVHSVQFGNFDYQYQVHVLVTLIRKCWKLLMAHFLRKKNVTIWCVCCAATLHNVRDFWWHSQENNTCMTIIFSSMQGPHIVWLRKMQRNCLVSTVAWSGSLLIYLHVSAWVRDSNADNHSSTDYLVNKLLLCLLLIIVFLQGIKIQVVLISDIHFIHICTNVIYVNFNDLQGKT